MGARGPLKLVAAAGGSIAPVKTAATAVPAKAPDKPKAVADNEELSQAWDEIVPGLDAAGLLSTADMAAVEMALRHFILARKASDQVMSDGIAVHDKDGYDDGNGQRLKKHPSEAVFRLESTHFLEYAKQLGMTFLARARTAVPKEGDEGGNPFASQATG